MAVPAVLLPSANIPALEMWVDGYGDETHQVTVRKTSYPLESGASAIDHAVVEPDRLTLQGWVSNISPVTQSADRGLQLHERAPAAWEQIVYLARQRMPLSLITLLGAYENMIIVNVSANMTAQTGRGLRFNIQLEQLITRTARRDAGAPGSERVSGFAVNRFGRISRGRIQTTEVLDEDTVALLGDG